MIPKFLLVAFVLLLKAIADWLIPGIPVSVEAITIIIMILLSLIGVDVVELMVRGSTGARSDNNSIWWKRW